MPEFPYAEVAQRIREQWSPPTGDMAVDVYLAHHAMYGISVAMDSLANDQSPVD